MAQGRDRPRNKDETIEAVITNVFNEGPNGPYFVAISDETKDSSITCSWLPEVWSELRPPREGDVVILGDLGKIQTKSGGGGLRASRARLWRLEDLDE